MATENQHFDENTDLQASQKLSGDLKALFEPHGSVPPEVDRAVMDKVNRHSVRRRRLLLRWVGPVAAAAAAAVIVFAVMFDGGKERKLSEATAPYSENRAAKQIVALTQRASAAGEIDIDGSGRVDILDAFKLARYIRSTDRPEMKWDINGDGLVNRKDVDVLAFAAVRLDKGVL